MRSTALIAGRSTRAATARSTRAAVSSMSLVRSTRIWAGGPLRIDRGVGQHAGPERAFKPFGKAHMFAATCARRRRNFTGSGDAQALCHMGL